MKKFLRVLFLGLGSLVWIFYPIYSVQDVKAEANMRYFLQYVLAYVGGEDALTPQISEKIYTGPHCQLQPVTVESPSRLFVFLTHHGVLSAGQSPITDWGNQKGKGKHIYRKVQKNVFLGPVLSNVSYFVLQSDQETFDAQSFVRYMYRSMQDARIVCDRHPKTHVTKCLVRMMVMDAEQSKIYGVSLGHKRDEVKLTQNVCFIFRGPAPNSAAYLKLSTDQGEAQQFRTVYPAVHDKNPLDHTYAQKGC